MTIEDANELQAMLRYHCTAIIEAIDDGGIKPKQHVILVKTLERMRAITEELGRCPCE